MLNSIEIKGKEVTADALLTQREFARYLKEERQADYHFTVKGNQGNLLEEIKDYFQFRKKPDFAEDVSLEHGRIERRSIWTTTQLNASLDFPCVGQTFVIEREKTIKKTGKYSKEIVYGICSKTPQQADPQQVLSTNRGHWSIENCSHYIIDWNYDEDRGRISKGYGPENVTRLRRFCVGVIKGKKVRSVAQKMRILCQNTRLVFDYLCMTKNTGKPPI